MNFSNYRKRNLNFDDSNSDDEMEDQHRYLYAQCHVVDFTGSAGKNSHVLHSMCK